MERGRRAQFQMEIQIYIICCLYTCKNIAYTRCFKIEVASPKGIMKNKFFFLFFISNLCLKFVYAKKLSLVSQFQKRERVFEIIEWRRFLGYATDCRHISITKEKIF